MAARPAYTARRREALHVVRADDGALEIGCGRLRILPGSVEYFRGVVAALAAMVDLPGGIDALERGDAVGRRLSIVQPVRMTVPPNAWAVARSGADRIVFEPADWPRPGDPDPLCAPSVLRRLFDHVGRAGVREGEAIGGAAPEPGPDGALRLSCRPSRQGEALSFPYVVENLGSEAAYVMDGIASTDAATREACLSDQATVAVASSGTALVGRFVPPPPPDRVMAAPVVPLARLLPPGGRLERRFELMPPYAETCPWLPAPLAPHLDEMDIDSVSVAVAWWPASRVGRGSEARWRPELHAIRPSCGAGGLVRQRFPVNGLRFSRRRRA